MERGCRKSIITTLLTVFACMLAVVSVFVFIPMSTKPSAEGETSVWDGDLAAAGWGVEHIAPVDGKASEDAPSTKPSGYVATMDDNDNTKVTAVTISDAASLAYLSREIYEFSANYEGCEVTLTTDVDLNNKIWIPIGFDHRKQNGKALLYSFKGSFDGGNKTIYNFNGTEFLKAIAYDEDSSSYTVTSGDVSLPLFLDDNEFHYGLFGAIYGNSTSPVVIKNLTIDNFVMDYTVSDIAAVDLIPDSVAPFVGYSHEDYKFENCKTNGGYIKGAEQNSENTSRKLGVVGGMVGRSYSTTNTWVGEFIDCVNKVDIGTVDYNGVQRAGFIGYYLNANGRITFTNCQNYGNVRGGIQAGGFISFTESKGAIKISNCSNYGDISISNTQNSLTSVGGFIGYVAGGTGNVQLENCINEGNIYAGNRITTNHVGGLFGYIPSEIIVKNCINYGKVTNDANNGNCYTGGLFGCTTYTGTKKYIESSLNYGEIYYKSPASENDHAYVDGIDGLLGYNRAVSNYYANCVVSIYAPQKSDSTTAISSVTSATVNQDDGLIELTATDGLILEDNGKTLAGIDASKSGNLKVVVPATVTAIKANAFTGKGSLKQSKASINNAAIDSEHSEFVQTQFVKEVDFSAASALKEIGDLAFAGTDVSSIKLPPTLEKIGVGAFASTNITSVSISENITLISDAAFGNNSNLACVTLGQSNVSAYKSNVFNHADGQSVMIVPKDKALYDVLSNSGIVNAAELTRPVTVEYYDLSVSLTEPVGTELKLFGNDYKMSYDSDTDTWVLNNNIDYVGLPTLGGNSATWYTSDACTNVATISAVTEMLAVEGVEKVKLYTRTLGVSDSFIAKTGLVYDGTSYSIGAINALLATNSKKVTTETVAITAFNGSTENLPSVIHDAGTYTVTITPEGTGEVQTLTITIAKANVELSTSGALQWRVNGSTLSDGPVYLVDGVPTLTQPGDGTYTVEAAIESIVRVRSEPQTLSLTGTGFTATVQNGSSAQGSAIGKYTTTYTLTSDNNYILTLSGAIVNGSARGLTVTLDGNVATVTKVWYIVAMGNWLVDNNGNDYTIADRVYGSNVGFVAPHLHFGDDEASRSAITYTLTRSGYNGLEFTAADFAKYLNNTIPVGSYTLRVSAPAVEYYENDDESEDPITYPAFIQDVTFEVTAATLSFDQGISGYLNGSTFSYIFGETGPSEANAVIVNSINGALENIYRNLPTNISSYWGAASRPVIEVNLVSDKTNVYSAFTLPGAVGIYNYYYRIRIDNYNIVDSDAAGAPLGFTLVAYGVVELPIISAHQYTGAAQVAFIADGEQYRVIKNDGGINAGTYDVDVELIHPEYYIWVDQTLAEDHPATRTVEFVIEQTANAWTRLPNIVNWSYESFDADVNRIRAVPLYLDTNMEMYFKVATDEEGANVVNGLGRITVDRNGKITDSTVIDLLNGLTVGRYYLVSVVDETPNYSSMVQSIGFNVTKASNYWASGESDLVLPSWVVGDYDPAVNTIAVNPEHGTANIRIVDINGNEYYNSVTGVNNLAEAPVGKYLLIAWVDASDNFGALAERTFTIEVLDTIGLPWWGTLLIVLGVLAIVAIVLLVLWKKGVFEILTGKLVLAIRTKATVDATIAAVRASKKADEAKAAIAAAKAKERANERKAKAAAERALPVEERAAALEAKAQAAAAKADKMRARADAMQARADRMKEEANGGVEEEKEAGESPVTEQPETAKEAPVAEQPESTVEQPTEPETANSEAEAAATATEEKATTKSNNRPSKKSGTKK